MIFDRFRPHSGRQAGRRAGRRAGRGRPRPVENGRENDKIAGTIDHLLKIIAFLSFVFSLFSFLLLLLSILSQDPRFCFVFRFLQEPPPPMYDKMSGDGQGQGKTRPSVKSRVSSRPFYLVHTNSRGLR